MRKLIPLLFLLAGTTLFAADMPAPKAASTGGKSPHETTSAAIGDRGTPTRVIVVYGRPYSKDAKTGEMREIWGKLVPYGKIWRTGSDEATLLITQAPIMFGSLEVPAGAYTLFTYPTEDGAVKLVINKQIGQWGIDPYNEGMELGRVDMVKETLPSAVDQFTMAVTKPTVPQGGKSPGTGAIVMKWDTTQYSAPFSLKK